MSRVACRAVAWRPADVTNNEGVHAIDTFVMAHSKTPVARKLPARGLSADEHQVLVQAAIVRTVRLRNAHPWQAWRETSMLPHSTQTCPSSTPTPCETCVDVLVRALVRCS